VTKELARAATVKATLKKFLDGYLSSRTDLKPNSQIVSGHTRRTLIEFFGSDKPICEITSEDAKAWREHLTEQGKLLIHSPKTER